MTTVTAYAATSATGPLTRTTITRREVEQLLRARRSELEARAELLLQAAPRLLRAAA